MKHKPSTLFVNVLDADDQLVPPHCRQRSYILSLESGLKMQRTCQLNGRSSKVAFFQIFPFFSDTSLTFNNFLYKYM
ncbi:hypothetical protein BT96DRAFT_917100, partial [Gymnopus androsaceus JB14]